MQTLPNPLTCRRWRTLRRCTPPPPPLLLPPPARRRRRSLTPTRRRRRLLLRRRRLLRRLLLAPLAALPRRRRVRASLRSGGLRRRLPTPSPRGTRWRPSPSPSSLFKSRAPRSWTTPTPAPRCAAPGRVVRTPAIVLILLLLSTIRRFSASCLRCCFSQALLALLAQVVLNKYNALILDYSNKDASGRPTVVARHHAQDVLDRCARRAPFLACAGAALSLSRTLRSFPLPAVVTLSSLQLQQVQRSQSAHHLQGV